jgi:hypothetical protein
MPSSAQANATYDFSKEDEVTQTIEEKNKAFVLEAFETLFVKRDYAAAERFWAPNYIQHSAHIPPGREGLFNMIASRWFSLRERAYCRQWRLRDAPRPV